MDVQHFLPLLLQHVSVSYPENTDSENKLGLGEFITNDAGYFAFPEGLQMGSYRIVEIGAEGDTATNYELIYDGSDVRKDNKAQNTDATRITHDSSVTKTPSHTKV